MGRLPDERFVFQGKVQAPGYAQAQEKSIDCHNKQS
jgi:hypothetical protein